MSVCVCKGRERKLGVQVCVHVLGFWCVVFQVISSNIHAMIYSHFKPTHGEDLFTLLP